MGDIADMMLDGTLCEGCGAYMSGEPPGYPRYCSKRCAAERNFNTYYKSPLTTAKVPCFVCGKFVKKTGLFQHINDTHPKGFEDHPFRKGCIE